MKPAFDMPLHLVLACLGYVASASLIAWGFAQAGSQCAVDAFLLDCEFAARPDYNPLTYGLIGATTLLGMGLAYLTARDKPWYLAIVFFGVLVLLALVWDSAMQLYVANAEKLINDTVNTLRFAVWASHLLFIPIIRHLRVNPLAAALAVAVSFAGVSGATVLFEGLSSHVMGATRLLMLFIIYAFVGFGVHLMSMSMLTAHAKLRETI